MNKLKHLVKLAINKYYKRQNTWLKEIEHVPRYNHQKTILLEHEITFVDSASFLFMYGEIFEQEIYKFNSLKPNPFIIDAGANIGLSVIYFKKMYPNCKIIAFEPDLKIFKVLEDNIKSYSFSDITLINKAVWDSDTTLDFMEELADGGRIIELEDNHNVYQVKTVKLRDFLNNPIDFLKIDIEGAETNVLIDCQDLLYNVRNIFIEYHSFANQPQTLNQILEILSRNKFRYYIHQMRYIQQPFINSESYLGMDMILNIFAWRSTHHE